MRKFSMQVLIVEDDKKLSKELEKFLSQNGYEISRITSFENIINDILNSKCNMVLLDINLPGNNGEYICKEVRKISEVPIVMITSVDSELDQLISLNYGADDYITKSFNAKILLIKINNILRNRELLHHTNTDNSQSTNVPGVVQNESDKKLLDKIKEIVEKNIENPDFNIEQLASEVCMGRSAFFEKIKDITGTTPANFILECRLNKATALLIKNPTLRMDDIAAYLGFSSGRYFCKCFKNHFGISPLQYRKQDQG